MVCVFIVSVYISWGTPPFVLGVGWLYSEEAVLNGPGATHRLTPKVASREGRTAWASPTLSPWWTRQKGRKALRETSLSREMLLGTHAKTSRWSASCSSQPKYSEVARRRNFLSCVIRTVLIKQRIKSPMNCNKKNHGQMPQPIYKVCPVLPFSHQRPGQSSYYGTCLLSTSIWQIRCRKQILTKKSSVELSATSATSITVDARGCALCISVLDQMLALHDCLLLSLAANNHFTPQISSLF